MSNRLKNILLIFPALFALPLLLFAIAFFSTGGTYAVPATVGDDPRLPKVVINQVALHAEAFGNPAHPPLLVLHDGPGGDYHNLLALKALADHYVIFYDQRGSGLSARLPGEQLNLESMYADLDAVIAHFAGNRPLRLLGHGWGGMLASAYAGRHPGRVERLVLAEPGFLNTEMAGQVLPVMNQASVSFLYQATLNWVRSLHVDKIDSEARSDFVFARLRHHPAFHCGQRVPADAAASTRRAGFLAWKLLTGTSDPKGRFDLDFTQGLDRYERPVLLLAGSCNTLTGKAFQTRQARLFRHAAVVTIPDSGHELFLDQPEASMKAVRAYLSKGTLPTPSGR